MKKKKTGFRKSKVARRLSMKKTIFIFCALLVPLYFVSVANAEVLTSISGRVIAEDTGEGLAAINIQANYMEEHALFTTVTDENGFYVLKDLRPGRYILSFYKGGDNYVEAYGHKIVELIKGKNLVNVNHTMNLGGSVSGTVYDADGVTPLGGIGINGEIIGEVPGHRMADTVKITVSDAEGRYELKGLPASDDCVVEVEISGHATIKRTVSIKKGENTGNIDFIVRWDDMTGISGYVRSSIDGKPMKGAEIYLENYSNESIGHTSTDDAGKYSIIGVPPGTYIVIVIGPGGIGSPIIKEAIIIELGTSTEVNFEFDEPAPISHFQESIWKRIASFFLTEAYA